jgi:hypothetical protein
MKKFVIFVFVLLVSISSASYCDGVPLDAEGHPDDPCVGTDLQSCINCVNCAAEQGRYNDEIRCSFGFTTCFSAAIDECQYQWTT